jgi:hypothetical protein
MWQLGAALFVFILTLCIDSKAMRIDWGVIAKFMAFMGIVACLLICRTSLFLELGWIDSPYDPIAGRLNHWSLGMVFWEDAFYVLPIYLFRKYLTNRWYLWVPLAAGLSLHFGWGHGYQGNWAIAITALYPFFISYRYGLRVGFGTVMICHILYDHVLVYLNKLMPILLF